METPELQTNFTEASRKLWNSRQESTYVSKQKVLSGYTFAGRSVWPQRIQTIVDQRPWHGKA